MNWIQKANQLFNEHLQTINEYIDSGIDRENAYNMVMKGSCIGAPYKAQIKKEIGIL